MEKTSKVEGQDINAIIAQVKRALLVSEYQAQVHELNVLAVESLELTLKAFAEAEAAEIMKGI